MKKFAIIPVLCFGFACGCNKESNKPSTTPAKIAYVTFYGFVNLHGGIDGQLADADFDDPAGIAINGVGNIYIADLGNDVIVKITNDGLVSRYAGNYTTGLVDGNAIGETEFSGPENLALDAIGNLYVAEHFSYDIRKITPYGVVSTLVKNIRIDGITIDTLGNIFGADADKNIIVKITPAGVLTRYAGSGISGSQNGTAFLASFYGPSALAFDRKGNLYVADYENNLIRKITPVGLVSTFAGSGKHGSDDGADSKASFENPNALTFDNEGNLYVIDVGDSRIRKITPDGIVSTLAGNDIYGSSIGQSANGPALNTSLGYPHEIAVDTSGNIYFTENDRYAIGKISFK